jgi:protein prenyltransferase alpha subunit repeat containing protein 1
MKDGDQLASYKAISRCLLPSPDYKTREIEILPGSHQLEAGTHYLEDGAALAVSKLSLVQSFFIARRILQEHLDNTLPRREDELLAATAVILLMDPEHLTAANTRKRLVQSCLADHVGTLRRIVDEQKVTDTFLTSRLHRHTKSPTLWQHRRWLVQLSMSLRQPVDIQVDVVTVVMVAGERHPRNYYAWNHGRWLTSLGTSDVDAALALSVKSWCLRNHTDISGWSFLQFLLLRSEDLIRARTAATPIFEEVLHIASSLRWTNESVWVFLRTMAASRRISDGGCAKFEQTAASIYDASKATPGANFLTSSTAWYRIYRSEASQVFP